MNMCLLEVAMCEKCRSSHFQSEGATKKFEDLGGSKILGSGDYQFFFFFWGGVLLLGGEMGQYPHYMPWIN